MFLDKFFALLITTLLSINLILAQGNENSKSTSFYPQPEHPNWFKAIPLVDQTTPKWAIKMYTEDSNFNEIEALKDIYYASHKFEKNIHIQNYKHWFKIVNQHINEAGKVELPDPGVEFRRAEERKKEKKALSNKSMINSWTNIGPEITFKNDGSLNTRPTQANVYCMGVAPSNVSVLYAGMETGGIFKSTDKGLNWFPVSYDYSIGNLQDIKVDPLDEDIVYACRDKEIYKTINGGTTWSLIYTSASRVEQFYIHTINTDTIYAATQSGLLKSVNGGSTWVTKFTGYVYDIEAKPGTNEIFYISVKDDVDKRPEIHKSIDSGDNWTLMDNGFYSPSDLSAAIVYGCKIGVTPADPNRLYAGIIATGKPGDNGWIGIYYSLDEGVSWQEDSGFDGGPYVSGTDPATNWYVGGYSNGYHQGWYNFDIDVSHNNADKIWIGTIWFCESGNKGGNIEYIRGSRNLEMHADIQDIDVVGNDIWVTSDGGINYSNDEFLTTEVRMNGITASDFWGFGHGWNEDIWVGGRYHNGNVAQHSNFGPGQSMFLGGAENATGYINRLNNRKASFTDIGDKLIPDALNLPSSEIPNLSKYPTESYFHFSYSEIEWHPYYGNQLYVGNDSTLYKSTDNGFNFSALYQFPGKIRRFEICRDDPNYIYAIVDQGSNIWRIHKSIDGGLSFVVLSPPPYASGTWRNLSIVLNPTNKNEIWQASNSSSNGEKIYSSIDGGITWTNRYTPVIENEAIKDLVYHTGVNGNKVYALTNENFYYYNIQDNIWQEYSDGLPIQHTGFMIFPFYRDNKIRMASAKGIWEVLFDDDLVPQSLPMVEIDSINCSRDTISLESHSIVEANGATWDWTISPSPQYISSTTDRNPKVVFGTDGSYDITLSLTDANTITSSKTITDMVAVSNYCEADSIAGMALATDTLGGHKYMVAHDANLTNLTHFTITGWWKPFGGQMSFAALVSSGDWCAHCDYTEGLITNYDGTKLWYKWPGNSANWGSNSGMTIPLNEWSYVALVITPNGATMYLNDQKYTHNIPLNPGDISSLYFGRGHYNGTFRGDIDEVTIWSTALSDDQVRKLRHITKEDIVQNNPNLIGYYQFNEIVGGSSIMDMAGTRHGTLLANTTLNTSTAPVGGGNAQVVNLNSSQAEYNASQVGAHLFLSDCENIDGKLVVSRLNVLPDSPTNGNDQINNYWIINAYNTTGQNPVMDSIKLTTTDANFIDQLNSFDDAIVHTRSENAFGATWTVEAKAVGLDAYELNYDRKSKISSGQQFTMSDGAPTFTEIDPGKPCEVDTVPGRVIIMPGNNGDYAMIPNLNLNTNSFTVTTWMKPTGIQNDWAGILFCRGGNTTAGFNFATNNELRYHWNGDEWGWSSGAIVPTDVWSHVALVVQPDSAKIYLNGIEYGRARIHAIEEFDNITRIGNDASSGSRTFNGELDELCIWNRALSKNEIRGLRHLTKEDIITTDPDLVVYYQFNEVNGKIYDKTADKTNASLNGNLTRATSNVPVGGGVSELLEITGSGTINSITGLDLVFDNSGTYPNGDIVITRIHLGPDTINQGHIPANSYWVINNYGANQNFSALSSLTFNNPGHIQSGDNASQFMILQRNENGFGPIWTTIDSGDAIDTNNKTITFNSGLVFGSSAQITVDKIDEGKYWLGTISTDWDNPLNWAGNTIPSSSSDVIIPSGTPFSPIVNVNVNIRTLTVVQGATVLVPIGILFVVEN